MKNKTRFAVLIMVAVLTVEVSGASALGSFSRGGRFADKRQEKIADSLNLSQAQRDSYAAASKQAQEEAKAIRQKNQELFAKIKAELIKDAPDIQAVHDDISQIEQNRTRLEIMRVDQLIELRKSLTPEQKGKLETLLKERHGKFGKRAK